MDIQVKKDLVFFDIESTGLNILRDRIIQIACIKLSKNQKEPEELSLLVNPGIPISEESMSIHGITPQDVANKPSFQQVARELYDFIGDADLGGYNAIRFDIPMLMEEFARVGIDFDLENRRLIDVQRLFYKMEPRTLKAAVKFYCQREFEDAHDALSDVRATLDVFKGQLDMYEGVDYTDPDGNIIKAPVKNDIKAIHDFTNDFKVIDVTQKLKLDHKGNIIFNFGKYMGKPVGPALAQDKQYYHWILEKDFSSQVKKIVKQQVKEFEKGNL